MTGDMHTSADELYFANNIFTASLPVLLLFFLFSMSVSAEVVNINRADEATLLKHLIGVGPNRISTIINYRTLYGPITSLEQFSEIPGINKRIVEKNRSRIGFRDGIVRLTNKKKTRGKKSRRSKNR